MVKQPKVRIHKCSYCHRPAVWLYMPSGNGRVFYCDEHVPSGCGCNNYDIEFDGEPDPNDGLVAWWPKNAQDFSVIDTDRKPDSYHYQHLRPNGKLYPCCEYDYEPDGHEFIPEITVTPSLEIRRVLHVVARKQRNSDDKYRNHFKKSVLNIWQNVERRDGNTNHNELMTKVATFVDESNIMLYRQMFNRMRSILIPSRKTMFFDEWKTKRLNKSVKRNGKKENGNKTEIR